MQSERDFSSVDFKATDARSQLTASKFEAAEMLRSVLKLDCSAYTLIVLSLMMTVNLTNVMHMYAKFGLCLLDNFMNGYLCVHYTFRVMHLFVELDMDWIGFLKKWTHAQLWSLHLIYTVSQKNSNL